MLKPVHLPKGLNLRQSVINRNPEFAQDCRNVEKNVSGELILRWGYEKLFNEPGIIDLFEYIGAQDDPDRGRLVALKADGLYRLNDTETALEKIGEGNSAGQPSWTVQTKPVEYNKVLYWNDPSFSADLWKYDGYMQYRAGVPRASLSGTPTGSAYYFRVVLKFYDAQGNVTYSDFLEYGSGGAELSCTVAPLVNSNFDGFYQKYCQFTSPGTPQGVYSGNLTVSSISSHNYVAGDYARLEVFGGAVVRMVKIASVTSTSVTFDAASVGSDSFTVNTALYQSLERRWELEVYRSTQQFFNYQKMQLDPSEAYGLNGNSGSFAITTAGIAANGYYLSDVYDDTLVRVLPPKGKYLALYNEVMVIGNLGQDQPDFGYASLLGNDTRLEDSIAWSDIATLSNGSSIETFLVNNLRAVGNSEDGAISAVHGNDDNLVVHKEKQSYYINGDFISNTLRIRRAMTEQNGAASHLSVRNVEGGHLYTTPKGVFLSVGGSKPVELSDPIEPMFTDDALELGTLQLNKAKSVTDFLREKIYIYIPQVVGDGVVLVYDYYHKDWWLHDNIPASAGFQDVGVDSTNIYFSDGTALYKRNLNSNKDVTARIRGYYWTGWFDIEFPSLVKKFTNFVIMSIANKDFTATVTGYCNWDKTAQASNTIQFTKDINIEDTQVLQVQANSASYKISNETDGSDFHVTGYVLEFEGTQSKPKGDT